MRQHQNIQNYHFRQTKKNAITVHARALNLVIYFTAHINLSKFFPHDTFFTTFFFISQKQDGYSFVWKLFQVKCLKNLLFARKKVNNSILLFVRHLLKLQIYYVLKFKSTTLSQWTNAAHDAKHLDKLRIQVN